MSKRRLEGRPFDSGLRQAQSALRVSGFGLLLLLAGCDARAPTIIDGSSPQAFEESVYRARGDLPDADRLVFDRALRTVGGRWHGAPDQDKLARTTFDGMTAEQVVADQKAREGGGE